MGTPQLIKMIAKLAVVFALLQVLSADPTDYVKETHVDARINRDWAAEYIHILQSHYGDPLSGSCLSDEVNITIQGVSGSVCSPGCTSSSCPTDVPDGVTAAPQCALQDASSGKKYCALICSPSGDDSQCGTNASCKAIQGVGICTYDDDQGDNQIHTHVGFQPSDNEI